MTATRHSYRSPGNRGAGGRMLVVFVLPLVLLAGAYWMKPAQAEGPVTYRIGAVDPRFGLSREQVSDLTQKAVSIWSKAAGRELFREDPKGRVEVVFVYDYRQEASDKLRGLSGNIDNTKASYDGLKARLEELQSEYREKAAVLEADIRDYNSRTNILRAESDAASQKGGMSEEAYRRFMEEKEALDAQREDLKKRQDEQNDLADTLNNMVVVINEIATNLNLEVVRYNRTGEKLKKEFNEGLYEKKKGRQTITVYHFTNRDRLVRVLAHEFGHALGVGHNSNPKALMYRLNLTDSLELKSEDLAGLKALPKGGY